MKFNKHDFAYLIVFFIGAIFIAMLYLRQTHEINEIKRTYIIEQKAKTDLIEKKVEMLFKELYQGLRTMTLLPGIRKLDRYGQNFTGDSKEAFQQIYNNTFLNVRLSEVYALPLDFDPHKTDPMTQKNQEPIFTFDEFITDEDKNREQSDSDSDSGSGSGSGSEEEKIAEIEIHEYVLMAEQIKYLQKNFPYSKTFSKLDIPAILGKEVITCDNTFFTEADLKTGDNSKRSGLVYTLPTYDQKGDISGAISGIVLTDVIRQLLPAENYGIINESWGLQIINNPGKAWLSSIPYFQQKKSNSNLIYSEFRTINIKDATPWEIWISVDDTNFYNLNEVEQAQFIRNIGILVLILLTLITLWFIRSSIKYQSTLEETIAEKTKDLAEKNSSMKLIFNNADQGFMTVGLDGTISGEVSQQIEQWFPKKATHIWDLLFGSDQKKCTFMKYGWEQLVEDIMPFEVTAKQMPRIIYLEKLTLSVDFRPIYQNDSLVKVLVIVSDITIQIANEAKEREQKELFAVFQNLMKDRHGFLEFIEDAKEIVTSLAGSKDHQSQKLQMRLVHTLKGNTSQYGLITISELCHKLESDMIESGRSLSEEEVQKIKETWKKIHSQLDEMIGRDKENIIEVDKEDYENLISNLKNGMNQEEIKDVLEEWSLEPVSHRLQRLGDQAQALAKRLRKPIPQIVIKDNHLRLEGKISKEFWSNLIHLIRNSIDHGFTEDITEPKLIFEAQRNDGQIILSISDNGVGIDWTNLKKKAEQKGIAATVQDEDLIFIDGLSSKDEVSDISGRGVGLAAIKMAVEAAKGQIIVSSQKGQGTTFTFIFPT